MNTHRTAIKCGVNMRIIAFIEDHKVVKKILGFLGIYKFKGTGHLQAPL